MKGIILCSLFLFVVICCSNGAPVETQPYTKKSARAVGASASKRLNIAPYYNNSSVSTKSYIDTHPHPKKRRHYHKRHHKLHRRRHRHKLVYPLKDRLQYFGGGSSELMPSAKPRHEDFEMTNGEVFEHGGVPDLKDTVPVMHRATKKGLTYRKAVVNETNGGPVVALEGDVDQQINNLSDGSGDDNASASEEKTGAVGDVIYADNSTLFLFHDFGVDNKTDDKIRKLLKDVAGVGSSIAPFKRPSSYEKKARNGHVAGKGKTVEDGKENGSNGIDVGTFLVGSSKWIADDTGNKILSTNTGTFLVETNKSTEYEEVGGNGHGHTFADISPRDPDKPNVQEGVTGSKTNNGGVNKSVPDGSNRPILPDKVMDNSNRSILHDKMKGYKFDNAGDVSVNLNKSMLLNDKVNEFKIDNIGVALVNTLVDSIVHDKISGHKSGNTVASNRSILHDKVNGSNFDDASNVSVDSNRSILHDKMNLYQSDNTDDTSSDSNPPIHGKVIGYKVDNASGVSVGTNRSISHDEMKQHTFDNTDDTSSDSNKSSTYDKVIGYKFDNASDVLVDSNRSILHDKVKGYKFNNTVKVPLDSNGSMVYDRVKGSEGNDTGTGFSNNSTTSEDQIIRSISKFPPIKVHSDVGDFLMPDLHDIFSQNTSTNHTAGHKRVCKNRSEVTGPTQQRGDVYVCEPIQPVSDEYTSETVGSDMIENPNDYDNGSTWHNFEDNRDVLSKDERLEKDSSSANLITKAENKSADGQNHDTNLDVTDKQTSSNKTGEQKLNISNVDDNNSTNLVGYMDNEINEVLTNPTNTSASDTASTNDILQKLMKLIETNATNTSSNGSASTKDVLQNGNNATNETSIIEGPLVTHKIPMPLQIIPIHITDPVEEDVDDDSKDYHNDDDDNDERYQDSKGAQWLPYHHHQHHHHHPAQADEHRNSHADDNYPDERISYNREDDEPNHTNTRPSQNDLYNSNRDLYQDDPETFDNPNLTGKIENARDNVNDDEDMDVNYPVDRYFLKKEQIKGRKGKKNIS